MGFHIRITRKVEFARHSSGGRYCDLLFTRASRLRAWPAFGEKLTNGTVKKVARRWLGERMAGSIDYYRYPEQRSGWGGPFNGQANRVRIFRAIIETISPAAIIETGTYLGTTTEFMASFGTRLYSIEGHPRNFGFALARLWRKPNVRLYQGDSRAELTRLFAGPLQKLSGEPLFVYLDAHWKEDLPLAAEIEIIFSNSSHAVVMIDDFEVPDDPGYGFDDYGPGKALNADYIARLSELYQLAIFYPSTSSKDETGSRRGCVILCKAGVFGSRLEDIPLLRRGRFQFNIS